MSISAESQAFNPNANSKPFIGEGHNKYNPSEPPNPFDHFQHNQKDSDSNHILSYTWANIGGSPFSEDLIIHRELEDKDYYEIYYDVNSLNKPFDIHNYRMGYTTVPSQIDSLYLQSNGINVPNEVLTNNSQLSLDEIANISKNTTPHLHPYLELGNVNFDN